MNSSITEKSPLHLAQSFRLDHSIRRRANLLEDSFLHVKLQNSDMIAQDQDAVYRKACLSNLYRTASKKQLGEDFLDEKRRLSGIAFGD